MQAAKKIVVIGGSAGSLPVIISLMKSLPVSFAFPIIIVLHRQRNVKSEMKQLLVDIAHKKIIEPDDKEPVLNGFIYLAPQNYHLLVEEDFTFSLDYSEAIKFSRPSIDATFESAARVYGAGAIAMLLSGANTDGCAGVAAILNQQGVALVQDPATCEYPTMPSACLQANPDSIMLAPLAMALYLQNIV